MYMYVHNIEIGSMILSCYGLGSPHFYSICLLKLTFDRI